MESLQQHAVGNRTIQKRLGTGQGEMQLKLFFALKIYLGES